MTLNVEAVSEVAEHMRGKFSPHQILTALDAYFGLGLRKKGTGTKEKGQPTAETNSNSDDFFRDVLLPKHYQ